MDSESRENEISSNYAKCKVAESKGEMPNSNVSDNSLGTNPVNRVPPEVWEIIADNVISGTDSVSLSVAVPICGKQMYPKRVEWLFEQVLPLVLIHNKDLSKGDILTCRRVCKKWTNAVDVLVEKTMNNHYTSGENVNLDMNRGQWEPSILPYKVSLLDIAIMTRTKMLIMLKEAQKHPRNPIIGNCVKMEVPAANRQGGIDLVREFLETFGHHINFLHVSFNGKANPTTLLHTFVPLLGKVPNLKKLVVEKFMKNSSKKLYTPTRTKAVKSQLHKFYEASVSKDFFRNGIPKLDSLNLLINGLCEHTLKYTLIRMFSGEHLESLTTSSLVISQGSCLFLPNLVQLKLELKTNEQLKSVSFLDCPKVKKLCLNLENLENFNCELLFIVLRKFQKTLTHLEVTMPNFLNTFTIIVNGLSLIGDSRLMLFSDSDCLQMPKLKVLTLLGFRPPSFNFIVECKSLEYLNLYFERQLAWEQFLKGLYHPDVQSSEMLDLVRKLKPIWSTFECVNEPEMSTSNIWRAFPNMKCLKINKGLRWESLGSRSEWLYKRINSKM